MKLLYSAASPFVRKVRMVAALKKIELEPVTVDTINTIDPTLWSTNPLGKIPALILDHGTAVYDSQVICEYLDATGSGPTLFPADWAERLPALTLAALADGILDAAVLLVYEKRFRPEDKWVEGWQQRQQAKIDGALTALAASPPNWQGHPHYGHVTLGCALGYLDFRHGGAWRQAHSALVPWFDNFAATVPAFGTTAPP